jgi:hypothetical protein
MLLPNSLQRYGDLVLPLLETTLGTIATEFLDDDPTPLSPSESCSCFSHFGMEFK